MARYVVGDIQGCFEELQLLLDRIQFDSKQDQLFLLGDLVNRGPASLACLRWAYLHQDCVFPLLGNHDLHLLACHYGVAHCHAADTLYEILNAVDVVPLINWLRTWPLLIALPEAILVHAGILPDWGEKKALRLAEEVSLSLAGGQCQDFLSVMYGNKPRAWSEHLSTAERQRFAVNVFTRMRFVDDDGALDFRFKGELEKAPAVLHPWFEHKARKLAERRLIFGHWSALGLLMQDKLWALDTGCVWGGSLSAMRLEDGALFQQPALRAYQAIDG